MVFQTLEIGWTDIYRPFENLIFFSLFLARSGGGNYLWNPGQVIYLKSDHLTSKQAFVCVTLSQYHF